MPRRQLAVVLDRGFSCEAATLFTQLHNPAAGRRPAMQHILHQYYWTFDTYLTVPGDGQVSVEIAPFSAIRSCDLSFP